MKQYCGLIFLASAAILFPLAYVSAAAEDEPMIAATDKGSLDVELSLSPLPLEPDQETKMHIRFLQKGKNEVQQHIDYQVFVEKDGKEVFRIPSTHTNPGEVTIPYTFTSTGSFMIGVEVKGLHFVPIPTETAFFSVTVVPEFPTGSVIVMASAITAVLLLARARLIPHMLKI
jgi:predicted secreted protein with PEFG-CTERM motif